jgi:hypothetical protein
MILRLNCYSFRVELDELAMLGRVKSRLRILDKPRPVKGVLWARALVLSDAPPPPLHSFLPPSPTALRTMSLLSSGQKTLSKEASQVAAGHNTTRCDAVYSNGSLSDEESPFKVARTSDEESSSFVEGKDTEKGMIAHFSQGLLNRTAYPPWIFRLYHTKVDHHSNRKKKN